MSYQVLARKWRPHDFSSLLGQDHVVRALTHALTENRLHHAYLFTGTRGVGKTTISRILAKCLNCVGPDGKGGIKAEPCGVCEACRAIDEDRFVDYIEMAATCAPKLGMTLGYSEICCSADYAESCSPVIELLSMRIILSQFCSDCPIRHELGNTSFRQRSRPNTLRFIRTFELSRKRL